MTALARLKSIFTSLAISLALLLVVAHVSPIVPAISRWLTGQWEQPKGDVLIVLSADQLGDGTLGVVSYWRSVYAVRAWRSGGFQRIVVSGGKLGYAQSPSIARAMGDFMIALGVPREAIWLEEQSYSTRQNALFTAALIHEWPGKKVLLTSDCHMRRARRAFARAGIDTIPAPMPDIGKRWSNWLNRWECTWTICGEVVKFAYYRARGWI